MVQSLEQIESERAALMRQRQQLDEQLSSKNWELAGKQMEREGYVKPKAAPKAPGKPLWGRMVSGAKTIVKWAIIAVVATFAWHVAATYLGGFAAGTVANSIGLEMQALPGIVGGYLGNALTWLGAIPAKLGLMQSASLTGSQTMLASTALGGAAVAANMGGIKSALMAQTHSQAAHSTIVGADPSTLSIDPSAATQQNMLQAAMPDDPGYLAHASDVIAGNNSAIAAKAAHAGMQAGAHSIADTAGHVAADKTQESFEHHRQALQNARTRNAAKSWTDYVSQNKGTQIDRA